MSASEPLDQLLQLRHDLANEREAVARWRAVAERRREPSLNGGMPTWVKAIAVVGLPGFIALYLLGAIPFLPSPIQQMQRDMAVAAQTAQAHTIQTDALLRAVRQTCRGAWKGTPEMQEECTR